MCVFKIYWALKRIRSNVNFANIIIIIIIFWLKHQYLKHKYQSMVQQIIANMLSETVYTGITNLYIITKNQQNTKQYIINVNSVF